MDGLLNKFLEKFWLKYMSIPVVAAILLIACVFNVPEKSSDSNVKFVAVLFVSIFLFVFYLIFCIQENILPKARSGNWAVLFVVDAESDQLFNDVMKKLISSFSDCINCGSYGRFQAICIKSERVRKYDLHKREDVIDLLHSTHCVFYVHAKYRVDSTTHAENFEMHIDYGVVHQQFEATAKQILQTDMGMLSEPIKKRRFNKTQTLDEFDFTAQALSVICQYVIGLVMLLSGRSIDAYEIFHRLNITLMSKDATDNVKRMQQLVLKRLYSSCLSVAKLDINLFYTEKSLAALDDLNMKLEEANSIISDTYLYYLHKAYYYVARYSDISSAKICVDKCKLMNQGTDWRYSVAFLEAYNCKTPMSIYKKYCQAFKTEQDLPQIVDFIEYFIEKEPEKATLHLAAGLVYDEIGDTILAKQHFGAYLTVEDDTKIRTILASKMEGYSEEPSVA